MNSSPDCSPRFAETRPQPPADGDSAIRRRRAPTLLGIALFKLGKGVLFLALALVLWALSDDNISLEFRDFAQWLKLNPETKLMASVLKKLEGVTEAKLIMAAAGAGAYAMLAVSEGIGLLLRYSWAAYLAIAESAVFIPLEIHDLWRRFTCGMLLLFSLNVLIVVYLWRNRHRLFRHYHRHQPHPGTAG